MRITRMENEEKKIYDKCRKLLTRSSGKRKTGLHVSDLLSPRQAYFKTVLGERMSDKQMLYFITGRGHHSILEALQDGFKEHTVEKYGVTGTLDTFNGIPIEIKTTRSRSTDDYKVTGNYAGQLILYCVMTDTKEGLLVVLFLNYPEDIPIPDQNSHYNKPGSVPKIKCLDVSFTETELAAADAFMVRRSALIEKAIADKDFSQLPRCESWKCRDCGFLPECGEPPQFEDYIPPWVTVKENEQKRLV